MRAASASASLFRSSLIAVALILLTLASSNIIRTSPAWANGCVADPTVNSAADDESNGCAVGNCTLREAISSACVGSTIDFAAGLGTIELGAGGALMVDTAVTIAGPGADQLTVDGNSHDVVFDIRAQATISGLTITGGAKVGGTYGGGIAVENGADYPVGTGDHGKHQFHQRRRYNLLE